MLFEIWPEREQLGWQTWTEISSWSQSTWISWRSFMREIMVRGWVAITLSSHIPYCTPIHWYILLLALWASRGLLPFLSFSLAYLFWPGLGGLPLCALYLLIGSVSIMSIVSFFVFSFSHHCLFLFFLHFASSHRLPLRLVSIISIHFTFISFCVMMTCSHPRVASQVCHTLRSAYRLWSEIIRLRGSFGIGVSFGWSVLVWHSAYFGCSA